MTIDHADKDRPDIDRLLRRSLGAALTETDSLELALREPERNLFDLGLDSLRVFGLLDELAMAGVEVDFVDFTENPTCAYLRAAVAEAGHA